jgi:hypothetical protein
MILRIMGYPKIPEQALYPPSNLALYIIRTSPDYAPPERCNSGRDIVYFFKRVGIWVGYSEGFL